MKTIHTYLCVYTYHGLSRSYLHRSRHSITPVQSIMDNIMDDLGYPTDEVFIEQLVRVS